MDDGVAMAANGWLWTLIQVALLWAASAAQASGLREINPPAQPANDRSLVLVGARLIDGLGGAPLEDSVVVVQGSKIVAAGARASTPIPPGAELLSGKGLSVLPGFVDSHLHSINDLDIPARFLSHGVTTYRDPGHPFRFYQAVLQTDLAMPRVFLCGAHLDAYPPIWPQEAVIVKDAEHARRTIDQHVERGASAIKIYFRLPLKYFQAICETAEGHGIPVTAHLELVDADDAIRAGLDGVEHVTSFGTALAGSAEAAEFKAVVGDQPSARRLHRYRLWAGLNLETSSKLPALLDLIAEKDVVVSPTLAVFERRAGDDGATEVHVRGFEQMLEFVRRCHSRGITIVPGSHTSAPHAEAGWAYQRELELFVEAGMSPLEAITAGTVKNAKFLGAEDRIGSVDSGKLADLVLVEGNPAEDIRALYNVRHVMLNGNWVTAPPTSVAEPTP